MHALTLRYNLPSALLRWRSTLSTILGIALVIWCFLLVQMLAAGLEQASANTGDPRNLLVVRKGSTAESTSQITLDQFRQLHFAEGLEKDSAGTTAISPDLIVLLNLARLGNKGTANTTLRGVSPAGIALRTQVKLTAGRWFAPGKAEVAVSANLAKRFANLNIGETFHSGPSDFHVVGTFDAGGSAYDSEIWMDSDEARRVFDRANYSSLLIRPSLAAALSLKTRIESDKRLKLRVIPETEYYKEQTKTAQPIKVLGSFLAACMSVGAIFAAMNTMYAAVGSRTREIGTLRVLGFRRHTLLLGFLAEGATLALIGGSLGVLLALPINGRSTGTLNFDSFSESVFQMHLTPPLIIQALCFSAAVGILGSLLPALRASRTPLINALKSR